MGVLPFLVISAVCLINSASTTNEASCDYNGKSVNHGETLQTEDCQLCECSNGKLECNPAAQCKIRLPPPDENDVLLDAGNDPNIIETSNAKPLHRVKRGAGMGASMLKGGASISIGGKSMGGSADVKTSVISSSSDVKTSMISGGSDVKTSVISGGSDIKTSMISGGSDVKTSVISGGGDVKTSVISGGSDVKTSVISGGGDVKTSVISGGSDMKTSVISGGGSINIGGGSSLKIATIAPVIVESVKDVNVKTNVQVGGLGISAQGGLAAAGNSGSDGKGNINVQAGGMSGGVQAGVAVNGGADAKNSASSEQKGKPSTDIKGKKKDLPKESKESNGSGSKENKGKPSSNMKGGIKDSSSEEDHSKEGNFKFGGKSGNIKGGKKSSEEDQSKKNKGPINVGGKSDNSKESSEKGHVNVGGKSDNSKESFKKGPINIGGKSDNSKESSKKGGKSDNSKESSEKGPINVEGKSDNSKESSEKGPINIGGKSDNSKESSKKGGKSDNSKESSEKGGKSDNSKESAKKGPINVGGKSDNSKESSEKGPINVGGKSDNSKESSEKGPINVGGKSGNSKESSEKGPINAGGKSDNSKESSEKGPINVGGKSGNSKESSEKGGKSDNSKESSEKGPINVGGKSDNSKESSEKGPVNVGGKSGNSKESSEKGGKSDNSKESSEKGPINVGGKSDNSKESSEKGPINVGGKSGNSKESSEKGGKSDNSKESSEKGPINVGGKSDHSKESSEKGGKSDNSKESSEKGHGSQESQDKNKGSQESSNENKSKEVNEKPNPPEGESCTFNKNVVADGESVELDCVTCECNNGALTCVKNLSCPGICSVTGYQMIRTFDGTLYESPGTCSYILAKTTDFTITLNNKLCSELENDVSDPDAVCIEYVDLYIPSKASIRLQSDGTILVAGEKSALPYSVLDTITVLRSSSVFLDVISKEFTLQFDFVGNRFYVILDARYKDSTSGLCGTYNDNRNDDYRSSSDMTDTVSSLFSKSWKTQFQCSENVIPPEDRDKKVHADLQCSSALDSSIFEDCLSLIDTHSFKLSCSNSYYYGESFGLCNALADYAYRCSRAGIVVSVTSTFDCAPVCKGNMIPITEDTFTQQDCAEYSVTLQKITSSVPLNEACICPPELYYDASLDRCVEGDSCPCYSQNRVYRIGESITLPNGKGCPCERLSQCEEPEVPTPPVVPTCGDNEMYSDCLVGHGKSCEPSCQTLAILDQACTFACEPGCVCKPGLLRSSDGSCVALNECPCLHGEDVYNPGETLAHDCNTCTCENGKFACSTNACNKVCNAYAGSQFLLFDGVWKTFATRECAITLVESQDGERPSFSVVMQNAPNEELGGALMKKIITIRFGGTSVVLSNEDPVVVHNDKLGPSTAFKTYRSGFYVVVHFLEGLAVYYDQHLDVIVQLEPKLQGKVQGICGDADGTTTSELAISNMVQYSSQFLVEGCPYKNDTLPPPSENHKKYVENRCSLLKTDEFAECHSVVNVESYYTACVEETESCREGESCLCFCTSLAAYARACCRKGITIEWRTPDTCPSPCEYYNRESGEGPYRLEMVNGKSLAADYDTKIVSVEKVDASGILKATFMVTPSLYVDTLNGRQLISLESAEHHNFFIVQNGDGSLGLKKWQPSVDFRSQATFILRPDRWIKGYNALESYANRGQYLSINNNGLIMSPAKSGSMIQMNFKLVAEVFGLPSFSICTWKYKACGPPCIPTCQDPLGTKCTLTLQVEGCYPYCAPGMVFDEVTDRCVQLRDCITTPPVTLPPPASTIVTTTEPCRNVLCPLVTCASYEAKVEVPSEDRCCKHFECVGKTVTTPAPPPPTTVPTCDNVSCAPPERCTKEGEQLQQVPWAVPCCTMFKCVCQETCPPLPVCASGKPPLRTGDPDSECCPEYICESMPPVVTTTKGQCEGVTCVVPTCRENENLVEVQSENPCCKAYNCDEIPTPPPPPPPCYNVHCDQANCGPDDKVLIDANPNNPCCALFTCVPPTTPAPPEVTTTPAGCKGKKCPPEPKCFVEGSEKVYKPGDDPCCPEVDCECLPCSPAMQCPPGVKLNIAVDPESHCCPQYSCGEEHQTPPRKTFSCDNVRCESPPICKTGGTHRAVPWADPCCPKLQCAWTDHQAVTIDLDWLSNPHKPLHWRLNKSLLKDSTLIADCLEELQTFFKINTDSVTSFGLVWESHKAFIRGFFIARGSRKKHNTSKKLSELNASLARAINAYKHQPTQDHFSTIQQLKLDIRSLQSSQLEKSLKWNRQLFFERAPPPPPPTKGPCVDAVCVKITCADNEIKVKTEGSDPCCEEFRCECSSCTAMPDCNGYEPIMYFDAENECCPTYECPVPTTTPVPPTLPPTLPPPPPPCENVVCPPLACQKTGENVVMVQAPSDSSCCGVFACQCTEKCTIPTCEDGNPPVLHGDPQSECCPAYECEPPIPPPDVCKNVYCRPRPHCADDETQVVVKTENPCCTEYKCVPPVTTPAPPPPCFEHECPEKIPCDGKYLERQNPEDPCCQVYECVPPTPTTTPSPPTIPPDECFGVICGQDPVCTRTGESLVPAPSSDPCCSKHVCQCGTCAPPPSCDGDIGMTYNADVDCCPTFFCPPPPTTAPPPPPPCQNVVCESVTCTKSGQTAVMVEEPSETRCCAVFTCQCLTECYIPPCEVGQLPVQRGDSDLECCPSYDCVPVPTPPGPCVDVVCPPETSCGADETKVEVQAENPCCTQYTCIPPPPPPPTPPPPCSGVTCPDKPFCGDEGTYLEKQNPDDSCCRLYECVTPPPPTIPPPTTTPRDECFGVTCEPAPECTRTGESLVPAPSTDICCSKQECQCSNCPPAPYCPGGLNTDYDHTTSCCPTYSCQDLTTPSPPITLPPTTTPYIPPPPPPCLNVLCTPVTCEKEGQTPVLVEAPSDIRCCAVHRCECQEECLPVECADGSAPLLIGDPSSECCPEMRCAPPKTTPGICESRTCAPEPECNSHETKVAVPTDDVCCKAFFCLPRPTSAPTPPPPPPCEISGCPPSDCKRGYTTVEVHNPEDPCCPEYRCIPPTTPPVPVTAPDVCRGVTCKVISCQRKGETPVRIGALDQCCSAYKCECSPCPAAPDCGDQKPIVSYSNDCCPTYRCPAITTPPPKVITTIKATTHVDTCKSRICSTKKCKSYEKLVTKENPLDPCCPSQTCECTCKSVPSCGSDERLVAVQQNNQCCPKLKCQKKKEECSPVSTQVKLQSGKCSATVTLATCNGYCQSQTTYNSLLSPVSECRCCSVSSTRPINLELPCQGGKKAKVTVNEAVQCKCRPCGEEDFSGSGSGSGSGHASGSGSGSGEDGSGFLTWTNLETKI
ncbi:otogelin-like [Hyperolius riggenbachi]|uniref:otogelin-like n=1 Tax=Hyperolius riggenbachi TaxID=752182 RepID=UPI0035A3C705